MKKSTKKSIVIYSSIVASALVVGVAGGVVYKRFFTSKDIEYRGFTPESLKPNCQEIITEIDSYHGPKDKVDQFSAAKIINYTLEKYRQCENCYSFCYGLADTIIKQDIRNCQIKNGDYYFEDSTSKSSMVAVSKRMYEAGKGGDVVVYDCVDTGTIKIDGDNVSATFDESKKTNFSGQEYYKAYGKTLDEMFIYLICEETIIDSKHSKTDNGGYVVEVDLDPLFSTTFYQQQMITVSGVSKAVFDSVNLKFTLDSNLMLDRLDIDEQYTVRMGVDAPTHGMLTYYYFPNQYLKIPDLSENLTYQKK